MFKKYRFGLGLLTVGLFGGSLMAQFRPGLPPKPSNPAPMRPPVIPLTPGNGQSGGGGQFGGSGQLGGSGGGQTGGSGQFGGGQFGGGQFGQGGNGGGKWVGWEVGVFREEADWVVVTTPLMGLTLPVPLSVQRD